MFRELCHVPDRTCDMKRCTKRKEEADIKKSTNSIYLPTADMITEIFYYFFSNKAINGNSENISSSGNDTSDNETNDAGYSIPLRVIVFILTCALGTVGYIYGYYQSRHHASDSAPRVGPNLPYS